MDKISTRSRKLLAASALGFSILGAPGLASADHAAKPEAEAKGKLMLGLAARTRFASFRVGGEGTKAKPYTAEIPLGLWAYLYVTAFDEK